MFKTLIVACLLCSPALATDRVQVVQRQRIVQRQGGLFSRFRRQNVRVVERVKVQQFKAVQQFYLQPQAFVVPFSSPGCGHQAFKAQQLNGHSGCQAFFRSY